MWGYYVWLPGWSTSIALIGDAPDMMKPLSYGKNPADEIVYPFLYRGLIRYNPEENTARQDIAQCDISKIESITCTLNKDEKWSDGTSITDDDVIATFRTFSEFGENPNTEEVLRDTRISKKDGTITFSNPDKDINVLKLLTYPIYRSDMLEQLKTWRFATGWHITSGQYTFGEQVDDTAYIHNRITLIRNPNTAWTQALFDRINFKFFENTTLLKNAEDTIGIIIPPVKNQELTLSERFRPYSYSTYEYFSVFFQTDRMPKSLRNIFHWQIATSLSGQVEIDHKSILNIFSGKPQILPRGNIGNFTDIMKQNGYMKRDDWIASIEATSTTVTGAVIYDKPQFFKNKQNSNVLFVDDATGGILLSGDMDVGVTTVIINGYQLKEFIAGNKKFSYRVSVEDGTIKEWENKYLLEGIIGDTATTTGEILTVYYSPDVDKLAEYKKKVDDEYIARNNTPALVAEREREKEKQKETALALNPLYYYDKEGKPYTLIVAYVTGIQSTELYAHIVEDALKKLSVKIEPVALEPKDLQEIINSGKKEYDILIAWVSVGNTISDIWQLFDPAEAGNGINLSNIEIPKMVTLFGELRSATLTWDIDRITNDILKVMEEESFFFPISSPVRKLYIDRNLKWIRNIPIIAWPKDIYNIVEFASIRDAYVFDTGNKSFFGFFWWFGSLLF